MSLKPTPIPPVPEETARVARAAFPRGNVVMQLRDTLEAIYTDEAFADLFPTHGQPALAPWRLALVTVLQFLEGLTDRQAAEAVRDRLAWKYALSLELTDPGFDHSVLSEFRSRMARGKCRTTSVGSAPAAVSREGVGQSRRAATHRLDPCVSEDPCTQPHAVCGADDGLRVECALGGSARLGSRSRTSRMGPALWRTTRT